MAVLYSNNAASNLSASITSAATSFSVTSGQGALFPAPTGSDYFYVTLVDNSNNIEIVKVTARSVDTFTVTRGQDGTTARAWSANDKVELRIARALLDDFKTDTRAGYLPLSGGVLTGTLGLSMAQPRINLTETDGTSAYGQTTLIRNSDITSFQTRDSSGTFVSNDFIMTHGASGVSNYEWRVNNVGKLFLNANGVILNGNLGVGSAVSPSYGTSGNFLKSAGSGAAPTWSALSSGDVTTALGYTPYNAGANTVLTSSNYSSYALPLSGGTLTGKVFAGSSDGDSFEVRNDTASAASSGYITFKNKNSSGVYRPAARISGANVDNAFDGDFLIETYSGGVAYKGLRVDENSNVLFYDTSGNVKFQWDAVNSRALINDNVVLHAGNYGSYALPLSGGTVTGNVTLSNGAPFSFTALGSGTYNIGAFYLNSSLMSLEAPLASDSSGAARIPLYFTWRGGYADKGGLKLTGGSSGELGGNAILHAGNFSSYALPNPGSGTGGRVLVNLSGNPSWSDASFTYDPIMGQFRATNFRANVGDAAPTWNFNAILHAGNYTSYSPSLTGSGASGTWGISISGNASTAYGLSYEQLFNNAGANHSTRTDFNNVPGFGVHYVQGNGSGPSTCNQYYGFTLGLGNDYAYSQYAMQFAIPRMPTGGDNGNLYLSVRFREGGSWGSWAKSAAGYADTAGSVSGGLTTSNYSGYALPLSGGASMSGPIQWGPQGDNVNGSAWYGIGRNNSDLYGSGGNTMQVAGYYGLRLRSASAILDIYMGSAYFNSTFNAATLQNNGNQVLHAGNYTNYALNRAGDTMSNVLYFRGNKGNGSYLGANVNYALQAYADDGGAAALSFHRSGYYAVNLGLDPDNVLRIGGWSANSNRWQLDMSGNNTVAGSVTSGGNGGFMNNVYYGGVRNPIWRFGNADSYGLSYFQGSSGIGGADTIGFHIGTATAAGSNFAVTSSASYVNGNVVLHAGNISSYAPPISHTHNYVLKTGDTMTGRLTIDGSGWTTNNRNYSNEWIEFGNYSGLYSPNNGAHFYPNNGSYGSWRSAGSRNGWAGIEFDASNGNTVLMVDSGSNTTGFHNNSYGWQFRWNNGTAYVYKNAYGGGTAATVLDSSNYSNYALPIGGGWYGTGLPGSRWGGYSVNGGEISFGRDLPNTGQMGILVDGCYVAGENNGFWSMGSDNTWGSRRGMYWDGTYLRFDYGSPVSKMYALTVGNWDFYENAGGWNANIIAAGIYHGRVRVKASSYNSSGDQETYMWVDNTVTPSTGMYSTKNLFNFNGSITTVQVAGNTVLTGGNFTNYVPYGYPGWPGYPGTDANSFHSGSWLRSSFTYSNNAPHTGTIVHFPSSGYDLQLNGSYGGTSLSFRNRNGDNGTWNAWNTVLHSGNYTSYGDGRYLRGDGTTPVTANNLSGNLGIGRYFGYTYIQTFNSETLHLNPSGTNGVYINGNVAIHAGNVGSYVTSAPTAFNVVGSVAYLYRTNGGANSALAHGVSVSGSTLFYCSTAQTGSGYTGFVSNVSYNGSGIGRTTAFTAANGTGTYSPIGGTWRALSYVSPALYDSYSGTTYPGGLYVRVA